MITIKKYPWGYALYQEDAKRKTEVQYSASVGMLPISVSLSDSEIAELENRGELQVNRKN